MRSLAAVAIGVLAAAGWSACGGESGDLLALEVSGAPQAAERAIVVTEDGRGRCNGSALQPITNQQLIDARELEREMAELPEEERRLTPGEGRAYVARMRDGALRWSETSPGKPELFARLELLALQLGRELC